MPKINTISHSAWSKFWTCPAYYDIHYHLRLEPIWTTSALMFGIAIDIALNELHLHGKDPIKVFRDHFQWEQMDNVIFDKRDSSRAVFNQQDLRKLRGKSDRYVGWASLRVRGRALLEKYLEEIHPLIEKVHSVQKELDNRAGFIDLIAEVTLLNGEKVVIDFKTSYWPYDEESASQSPQLTLYATDCGLDNTAFCVLRKDVRVRKAKTCLMCGHKVVGGSHTTCNKEVDKKRCGGEWEFDIALQPEIQFILGKPSESDKKDLKKSFKITEDLIEQFKKTGFPKNMSTCEWIYGKRCDKFNYCRTGCKKGLRKRPKRRKL